MRSNLVSRASIFAVSAVLLASTGPAHAQVVLDGIVIQSAVGADGDNPADGAGRENVAADTPGLNSTTITQRELDITNPGDLADVFQAVPGITVGSSIPVSQKIYVNGVEETNLQVTIDGSRQNNKIFHHNATTYIDPELLKAVRVYAGVAPADAGPGALGGSIEFETKDVADLLQFGRTAGGSWKGQYESNGNIFVTSGTAYARSNGFEVLGFVKYADGDLRQDGSDEDITGSTTSLLSGLGKLAYQASSGDRFELSYERVQDDAQRPFRADIGAIIGRPADDRLYDLRRQNFVASYTDETPTAWWDPKVVFAYSVTDLEVFEQNFGETSSFNGKAQNRFRFGAHSITIGTDFFRDKTVGDFPLFNEFSEERITNIGSFAQLRLEPNEKLRLSVGGRYDRQWFEGLDGTEISTSGASGNASGEADLTSWLTVNAGVSQKWAGIKLAEPFIFNTAWSYADGIEDATARNAVAGLKLHGNGFSLLGRIFRTNLDDFRAPDFRAGPSRTYDAVMRGFDITGEYKWATGFARLAYANIKSDVDGRTVDSFTGRYLSTPIGEIITAQVVHKFVDQGVTVGVDAEIALDFQNTYNFTTGQSDGPTIPGYEVVNAFIEYTPVQLQNVTLRLDVKNIFDQTYASRATYGQEFATEVVPLREPGRSFKLTGQVKF